MRGRTGRAGTRPRPDVYFFADLFEPLLQILLVLAAKRGIPRAAVDLARFVFAFVELLARPLVVDVRVSSALSMIRSASCGGMKATPSRSPITRSPGITVTLPMRTGMLIPASDDACRSRSGARPVVRRHIHLRDAFQIADSTVDHDSAALGGLHDVVEEIVAGHRAAFFLPEQVHHQHVAGLQHVNGVLVVERVDSSRA